jgi:phage terminase Nu1 subunit (DNA packaging protein)
MALYTRKQFIELLGVSHPHLSMYIKRGKIIEKKRLIDSDNPYNADFMRKYLDKNKKEYTQLPPVPAPIEQPPPVLKPKLTSKYEIEAETKRLELEVKQKQNKLLEIKIEKQTGEAIPTELVKSLFSQHSKSIASSFKSEAENLFLELAEKYRLTSTDMVNMRNKLIVITNIAIERSVAETKKTIKNIVAEYSEIRGRGERK